MRGFGFKDNGFFICTETTPRCYVIQEVTDVNRALDDVTKSTGRGTASAEASTAASDPYLPFLPWWFTSECRQQLLNVPAPSPARASTPNVPGYEPSATPEPPGGLSPEQLRIRLKTQLEYYFSRENLMNDRYLRSQMDADQYVSIKIVASFPKITRLTNDYDLIVSVLRESSQVQVDEAGERVRPVTKRCTIILREIPEDANEEEVKAMFDGCPAYQTLSYAANNSWYVTFASEEDTQKAFLHLQNVGKTFNNKPVYARIKTGGAPIIADSYQYGVEDKITTNVGTAYKTNVGITPGGETIITGQITVHDVPLPVEGSAPTVAMVTTSSSAMNSGLNGGAGFSLGQILANHGYVPRASFRPSVTSTTAMTAAKQANAGANGTSTALAFTTPTVPVSMPMSTIGQQPRFLLNRSNVPFINPSSFDGGDTEKSKEGGQFEASSKDHLQSTTPKKSLNTAADGTQTSFQHSPNPNTARTNRPTYNNTSGGLSQNRPPGSLNRANSTSANPNAARTSPPPGFNQATPLNKVTAHDPNRSGVSSAVGSALYNKENNNSSSSSSYQKSSREYSRSSNNNPSERRERLAANTQQQSSTGRGTDRGSSRATRGGDRYDNNSYYYPSSKSRGGERASGSSGRYNNNNNGGGGREYSSNSSSYYAGGGGGAAGNPKYYNQTHREHRSDQEASEHDHSETTASTRAKDSDRNPPTTNKPQTFDFAETDFPSLSDEKRGSAAPEDSSKETKESKAERAQFSAVVAGRPLKVVAEEKRRTYAQTLKRSTNSTGHSDGGQE